MTESLTVGLIRREKLKERDEEERRNTSMTGKVHEVADSPGEIDDPIEVRERQ